MNSNVGLTMIKKEDDYSNNNNYYYACMFFLQFCALCQSVAIACKHLVVVLHLKFKNLCGSQSIVQLCWYSCSVVCWPTSRCIIYLYIYIYIYLFDFTAATAADRPALSARAGWKKEKKDI